MSRNLCPKSFAEGSKELLDFVTGKEQVPGPRDRVPSSPRRAPSAPRKALVPLTSAAARSSSRSSRDSSDPERPASRLSTLFGLFRGRGGGGGSAASESSHNTADRCSVASRRSLATASDGGLSPGGKVFATDSKRRRRANHLLMKNAAARRSWQALSSPTINAKRVILVSNRPPSPFYSSRGTASLRASPVPWSPPTTATRASVKDDVEMTRVTFEAEEQEEEERQRNVMNKMKSSNGKSAVSENESNNKSAGDLMKRKDKDKDSALNGALIAPKCAMEVLDEELEMGDSDRDEESEMMMFADEKPLSTALSANQIMEEAECRVIEQSKLIEYTKSTATRERRREEVMRRRVITTTRTPSPLSLSSSSFPPSSSPLVVDAARKEKSNLLSQTSVNNNNKSSNKNKKASDRRDGRRGEEGEEEAAAAADKRRGPNPVQQLVPARTVHNDCVDGVVGVGNRVLFVREETKRTQKEMLLEAGHQVKHTEISRERDSSGNWSGSEEEEEEIYSESGIQSAELASLTLTESSDSDSTLSSVEAQTSDGLTPSPRLEQHTLPTVTGVTLKPLPPLTIREPSSSSSPLVAQARSDSSEILVEDQDDQLVVTYKNGLNMTDLLGEPVPNEVIRVTVKKTANPDIITLVKTDGETSPRLRSRVYSNSSSSGHSPGASSSDGSQIQGILKDRHRSRSLSLGRQRSTTSSNASTNGAKKVHFAEACRLSSSRESKKQQNEGQNGNVEAEARSSLSSSTTTSSTTTTTTTSRTISSPSLAGSSPTHHLRPLEASSSSPFSSSPLPSTSQLKQQQSTSEPAEPRKNSAAAEEEERDSVSQQSLFSPFGTSRSQLLEELSSITRVSSSVTVDPIRRSSLNSVSSPSSNGKVVTHQQSSLTHRHHISRLSRLSSPSSGPPTPPGTPVRPPRAHGIRTAV
ncbi:hypothetical protein HDE_12629 [Halotydeus destructor]|nr:hypothetical protein HDE_12629 [Halotydeus destructor]